MLTQLSGPLECVYLHNKQSRSVVSNVELISALIIKIRLRTLSLLSFGTDTNRTTNAKNGNWISCASQWISSKDSFRLLRRNLFSLPNRKDLWPLVKKNVLFLQFLWSSRISDAQVIYIDDSFSGKWDFQRLNKNNSFY